MKSKEIKIYNLFDNQCQSATIAEMTDDEIYNYVQAFLESHNLSSDKYNVVISVADDGIYVPEQPELNRCMQEILNCIQADIKIEDWFVRPDISDILINLNTELIEKDFPTEEQQNTLVNDMKKKLHSMNGVFKPQLFTPYLKYVMNTVSQKHRTVADCDRLFSDHRVLLLEKELTALEFRSQVEFFINDFEPTIFDVITIMPE